MGSYQDPVRVEYCPSCGMPLTPEAATCGICGRAVALPMANSAAAPDQPSPLAAVVPVIAPAPALAAEAPSSPSPATAPEPTTAAVQGWAATTAPQPQPWTTPPAEGWASVPPPMPVGGWAPDASTMSGGMAALATTPVATAPARRTRRAGLIAGIAAVCLVAILGGSAYWIFASFLNTTNQTAAARYLPDNLVYYTSVDLIAAAANAHHVSRSDLGKASGTSDPIKQSIGLDWQNDVLPWVGRSLTVAIFPTVPGGSGGYASALPYGGALLIDSRDDAAAQRAIQKAINFQQQRGNTFSSSTYGGFTLHQSSGTGMSETIASGSGLVLMTTNLDAAHTVIDRANGRGATLAGSADFQRATSDLPANRFGTMYLNLRTLASLGGSGVGTPRFPFLDTYPSAGGALLWTQAGLRWQFAFKPVLAGVPQSALSGDTMGMASMVPEHVTAYAGIANTGQLVQEFARMTTPAGASSSSGAGDALLQSFGVSPDDPVVQQPAAFVVLPATVGPQRFGFNQPTAYLLHAPDAAATTALVKQIAQHQHLTMKATTVDGVSATALYSTVESSYYPTAPGMPAFSPGAGGGPATDYTLTPAPATPRLVSVAAMVNGTLVVASTNDTLKTIIETAHGNQTSLAQSAGFRQLVAQAPTGAASTVYLDLSSLMPRASGTGDNGALASHVTATLFTLVWDHSHLQGTYDVSLNQ